ncbi:hypothetical protein ACIRG5_05795 [Lentzea sp. NPDC102401]|uniref:hypothetical protein n=1 Tax=Lentzea sp. NPDC102401 TaxID=3364128 RepID=UPI00380EB267
MDAVWEGSRGLHVARLEPGTGVLTGIRPGQVKISVTANGVTSSADGRVSLREAA